MTTILQALLEDACQDGPYYDGVLGIDRTLMRRIIGMYLLLSLLLLDFAQQVCRSSQILKRVIE